MVCACVRVCACVCFDEMRVQVGVFKWMCLSVFESSNVYSSVDVRPCACLWVELFTRVCVSKN